VKSALDRVVIPLARAARSFLCEEGWRFFGYARLEDHARERLGRSARWARDLRALADALDALPGLAAALTGADGGKPIGRAAALLVGRLATTDSLAEWIALARRSTVRQLKVAARDARVAGSSAPEGVSSKDSRVGASFREDESRDKEDRRRATEGAAHHPDDETLDLSGSEEERKKVELPAPPPVRAAFDETLELFRAIEGREESATSFVEALVAEASSGPHPPDAETRTLRAGGPTAGLEDALAESTGRWSHLDGDGGETSSHELLRRLDELERRAGQGSATELDAQVRELVALEEALERELGALLASMGEARAWLHLQFASVGHYAEERLGLSRTQAQLRARVARQLREHPALRAAYDEGRLGLEAAAIILRILRRASSDPELEEAWLARAGGVTVKRLRDECRALERAGSLSSAEATAVPDGARAALGSGGLSHTIREKDEAAEGFRQDSGPSPLTEQSGPAPLRPRCEPVTASAPASPLSDADWMASLRRDRGTASRRVHAFGMQALSSTSETAMLRFRLPGALADDFLSAVEASRRALAAEAEQFHGESDGAGAEATPALLAARMCSVRSLPVPAWVGLLGLLEEFVATWDPRGSHGRRRTEAIYARDGWRCSAPGCTSRRNLEDHHLVYRSHEGSDEESNRICLCRFHHQQGEHGVLATCRGEAPLGIVWTLGRDAIGGTYRNERVTRASVPFQKSC
jgi:hypothetical protein